MFVSLVAMIDGALGLLAPVGGAPLSLERGFGFVFSPLAWCLGIPWKEAQAAGSLLGVKLMLTEFTAFIDLAKLGPAVISDRTPDHHDLRALRLRQHRLGGDQRGRLLDPGPRRGRRR